MNNLESGIRDFLAKDAEAVRPDAFIPLSSSIREHGVNRLPALAALLRSKPQDRAASQLFLHELFVRGQRQVGARLALYKTFVERLGEIDQETLDALPDRTRKALEGLKARASTFAVPMPDAFLFAHSLATEGLLCGFFCQPFRNAENPEKPDKKPETFEDALKAASAAAHPDKGGDTKTMALINRLRRAYRNEKQAT